MKYYDYIFYRIGKLYHSLKDSDYCWVGCLFAVNFVTILFIWLSLLFFFLIGLKPSDLMIEIPLALSIPFVFFRALRYDNQEKYDMLAKRYSHEAHSRIKGVLVLIALVLNYVIFSLIITLLQSNG